MFVISSLSNPEVLKAMPWRDKEAAVDSGGFPSHTCMLFVTMTTILENLPQITIQLMYTLRVGPDALPATVMISIAFSATSLFFRVILRFIIACVNGKGSKHGAANEDQGTAGYELAAVDEVQGAAADENYEIDSAQIRRLQKRDSRHDLPLKDPRAIHLEGDGMKSGRK